MNFRLHNSQRHLQSTWNPFHIHMVQFFVCRLLQPLSIFDNIQSFLQVRNPIWNLVCELNSKTQSVSRGATYELGVSAKLLKRFSQQKVRKRKLSPRKGFCLDSWNLFRGDAASSQTCTLERLNDIFTFLLLGIFTYKKDFYFVKQSKVNKMIVRT